MLVRRLGFLLPLSLPLLFLLGYARGGAWNFLVVGWVFGLLPVLDVLGGDDTANVLTARPVARGWSLFFDLILYAWVVIEVIVLGWAFSRFGQIPDTLGRVGFVLSLGLITGGVGIVVAHELGHRSSLLARSLGCLLLALVGYGQFYIEHNQGHHAQVATPADPATARAGESFWRFLPRSVVGGFAGAWRIERRRLAALGRGVLHPANRMLWVAATPLLLATAIGWRWGAAAALLYVLQSAIAVSLLECINYLEHYGLLRARRGDGRFETVATWHSWNSSRRISNWMTFNLQRHSHHHVRVTSHYEALEHVREAPQLPMGYPAMVLLACLPPLWRRIMDPRLAQTGNQPGERSA